MYSVTRGGLLPATTFGVKSMLFPLSFDALGVPLAQMKALLEMCSPSLGAAVFREIM